MSEIQGGPEVAAVVPYPCRRSGSWVRAFGRDVDAIAGWLGGDDRGSRTSGYRGRARGRLHQP